MTDIMRTAITKAVKTRISECDYLAEYSKALKLLTVEAYEAKGTMVDNVWLDGEGNRGYMMRLLATFSFKTTDYYDDNRVKFEICIYSDGSIGTYFEGTDWEA